MHTVYSDDEGIQAFYSTYPFITLPSNKYESFDRKSSPRSPTNEYILFALSYLTGTTILMLFL
jgi:hypothetical protein